MADPALHEIGSAIAAVVSAVGGCAGAVAAFRSARSARDAARSAEDSVHRAAIREVSTTASSVVLEVARLQSFAADLDSEYQTAGIFSGSFQNSGIEQRRKEVANVAESVAKFAVDASLFTGGAQCLSSAPAHEVDRVLLRLMESLATIRAMRDDLARHYAHVSAINAESGARQIAAKFAR